MFLLLAATAAHALELAVDDVVRGEAVTVTIHGAAPGSAIAVIVGDLGAVPCPTPHDRRCLGVQGGRVIASGDADERGAAVLVAQVPPEYPLVDVVLTAVSAQPYAATTPLVRSVLTDLGPGPAITVVDPEGWRALTHVRDCARDVVVTDVTGPVAMLPHLRSVAGLRFDDTSVREVRLPALTRAPTGSCATSTLAFVGNTALEHVVAPSLVTGSLCSDGNGPVAYDLPAWTTGGVLSLQSAARAPGTPTDAVSLHAPALATLDALEVYWTRLTTLSLPSLSTVSGPIQIWHDRLLTSLSLPALTSVGALVVADDPALSICDVEAIVAAGDLDRNTVVCHDDLYVEACAHVCER